jgi:hypothetical protein
MDRPSSAESSTRRLLTAQEGRALVHLAVQRPIASANPDCSHLVHQILSDAGLFYPYATSFEIFAGIPQFRRVRHAQPGDLIAWPGHVGLVVDPKRTTFFSSTSSGLRTAEYTSNYWRHRGYARFYRYVVTAATQFAAHRLRKEHGFEPTRHGEKTASLEASRTQEALYPSEPSSEAVTAADTSPNDPPDFSQSREFPESIPIDSDNDRPTKDDLEQAISELTNASASALDIANRRSIPVVFVRSWKIEKVKLDADQGWMQLRIKPSGIRNPDGTWTKLRTEKLHCDLRRDQTGWVLLFPRDGLYVSAHSK